MQVRDGMSSLVLTVGPGHTLREAARLMAERRVGAAVVIDPESPGPGIVTERDVLRSVALGLVPWSTTLEGCMTHDPISITPSTDTLEASHIMLEGGFRHLPVLEEGRLVGIVSLRDLLRAAEAERILRAREEERGDWRRRSTTE